MQENLQDKFLNKLRKDKQQVSVFLVNGIKLDGIIEAFDPYTILLRNKVISCVQDVDKSSNLKDLIRYEDDVAGGLMAKELVRCNLNWNIVQCIDQIRKQAEEVSKVYSVYVTDNYGKLIGKVSLKKIII